VLNGDLASVLAPVARDHRSSYGISSALREAMRMVIFAVTMLLVARSAAAECIYHNGYYDPDLHGACGVETIVPAGCPVHVATPSGNVPRFAVYRGMQEVTLQSSASLVDTLSVPMARIDPFDCDCARVPSGAAFDRYEVTVNGTVDGDTIVFEAGQLEGSTGVVFGPPGPCPAPAWPTTFSIATQCDRCPDSSGSGSGTGSAGGCSATDEVGAFALGSVLSALVLLRRRRAIAGV
jgi:uncharacterized protein (TIGR03382 family)